MAVNLIPVPANAKVHQIASPAFAVPRPPVAGVELIAPELMTALTSLWDAQHPARFAEFHSLKHVYVVGEGLVFDRDLNLFQASVTQQTAPAIEAAYARLVQSLKAADVEHCQGVAMLCGKAGLNNYGHWLAEMLPRVHLSREWVRRDGGWRVLVPHVYPWMEGVIVSSLDLLHVPAAARLLRHGQPLLIEELVLITGLTEHGHYFSPLVIDTMDAMAADIAPAPHRCLWITREGETRSLRDERLANEAISAAGWHVMRPAGMGLRDQISFAKGATHMAGVNGAGLSNLLFMRPGGTLTSFVPAVMPDVFYWQLSAHRGLHYREVRSLQLHEFGGPTAWDAPLTLGLPDVLATLNEVAARNMVHAAT